MKIGLIDLDTSHPEAFVPLLRERGHQVIGVWDGGSVHPAGYAREFAGKNCIPKVFESLGDMVPDVDCAIIHACDWDTHVEKARPFLDAGKSVLIDKPLAGNARDLATITEWAVRGLRIAGGSALLYCGEAGEWQATAAAERGDLQTVFCGCGVDEFNYGIHGYAMALGFAGFDVESVRHLGAFGRQDLMELSHSSGVRSLVLVGLTEAWLPFYATLTTTRQVRQLIVDSTKIYASLLDATLPFLSGEADVPPVPADVLVQPERCALAALISKQSGGRSVRLSEILQTPAAHDGPAFARSYRALKYPAL